MATKGKTRQDIYTSRDHNLLSRLITEIDKTKSLFSAKRDGGMSELKANLWTQITFEFNNASGRDSPSTKDQLIKVARAIRSSERKSLDTDFIDRANQSKFKASCSQTGGGQSDPPPKIVDPDEEKIESVRQQSYTNMITSNQSAITTTYDDFVPKSIPNILKLALRQDGIQGKAIQEDVIQEDDIQEESYEENYNSDFAEGLPLQLPSLDNSRDEQQAAETSASATLSSRKRKAQVGIEVTSEKKKKRETYYKLPKKTNVTDNYIEEKNKREEVKHKMELAVLASQINVNLYKAQLLAHELHGQILKNQQFLSH